MNTKQSTFLFLLLIAINFWWTLLPFDKQDTAVEVKPIVTAPPKTMQVTAYIDDNGTLVSYIQVYDKDKNPTVIRSGDYTLTLYKEVHSSSSVNSREQVNSYKIASIDGHISASDFSYETIGNAKRALIAPLKPLPVSQTTFGTYSFITYRVDLVVNLASGGQFNVNKSDSFCYKEGHKI